MSLPITPRAGQFIVQKDERASDEVKTEGGLYLVNIDNRAVSSGVVVQTEYGSTPDQNGFTPWPPGTRVYFSPWAGFTVFVNLKEYIQLAEHEILGAFSSDAEVYVG